MAKIELKYIPAFDNGHGGMINGVYQTPGKRSTDMGKGILYEGAFNRWVVNRCIEKMDRLGLPYFHISPELEDVSLTKRINRANDIYAKNKNVFVLSIHANASANGKARGIEGFTSVGQTKSDDIAEQFLTKFEDCLSEMLPMRFDKSDGDKDKESSTLAILNQTKCPAVLLELGFMDNQQDYNLLWSECYADLVSELIVQTIVEL